MIQFSMTKRYLSDDLVSLSESNLSDKSYIDIPGVSSSDQLRHGLKPEKSLVRFSKAGCTIHVYRT